MTVSPWEYAAEAFEANLNMVLPPVLMPHQKPPPGTWKLWLLEAGRGAGKTLACAAYFDAFMLATPGARGRIIAPTFEDAVAACIERPSGLLRVNPAVKWTPTKAGGAKVEWPNGSEARVMAITNKQSVERLRAGGNRHIDWWEEMAAIPLLKSAWDMAQMGLRLGRNPHSIASTTPRHRPDYITVRGLSDVKVTHATTYDNPYNPEDWQQTMRARFEGTTLGRQELQGQLLDEVEGAMFTRAMMDAARLLHPVPELALTVTAVDPSGSEEGDHQGVITGGRDVNGTVFVLADDSTKGSPEHRYETACLAAARWGSSIILYEPDYGGDSTAAGLRSAWEHLTQAGRVTTAMPRLLPTKGNPRGPKITGGKQDRAQPVVMAYEQQQAHIRDGEKFRAKVFHAQPLPLMEDELCTWDPDDSLWSPNRLDALVYLVRYLTDGLYGRASSFGGSAMASRRVG